ncbi:MAG TPA: nucleotide exchange factor GrpE [Rugosimonospora sp.]|nr:nucleotide exchange factor GrpE [Rugosimonospora sp.]
MSVHLNRMIAAAATAVVAAATAVVVQLTTGELAGALIALVGALVAGAAAGAALSRSAPPATPSATPPATPAETDRADRDLLVATSLYLRDRLTSAALIERLDRDLAKAGVVPVEPLGEKFDPAVHAAEGARPTTKQHLVGTIAVVDAPGYADRGVLLRPPTVTVYQPAKAGSVEQAS